MMMMVLRKIKVLSNSMVGKVLLVRLAFEWRSEWNEGDRHIDPRGHIL